MTEREGAASPGNGAGPDRQAVVYCLVPEDLAGKVHDRLRKHFAALGNVEVVVERRGVERRSASDRRAESHGSPTAADRRLIKGTMGRRTGERRAALIPTNEAPALSRALQRHAKQLVFVERLEPSTEEAENREAARLVARIQGGDRGAFADLYTRYFDRIYGYMRVALRDSHEAEDATQQVFMKVFEQLPDFEHRGRPFRNWLFAIARNHAISVLRKSGHVEVEDGERLDRRREIAVVDEPRMDALNWLTDRDLLLFVERLPLPQRQVLVLRYMLDLPNAEVAEILGRSMDDVKTLHHRGVSFLRKRFTAIGRTPTRRGTASIWPVFRQAGVLRHRRFALH